MKKKTLIIIVIVAVLAVVGIMANKQYQASKLEKALIELEKERHSLHMKQLESEFKRDSAEAAAGY